MLDHPENVRVFEACDGLAVVTSLFKSRTTSRELKMKLVEFLYFYLMPEMASTKECASATNTAVLGGRGKELVAAFDRRRETMSGPENLSKGDGRTRSTEEKQKMLGQHLSNVQDLVEDLKEGSGPFAVSRA